MEEPTLTQAPQEPTQVDPPLKQLHGWLRKKNSRFTRTLPEFEEDMQSPQARQDLFNHLKEINPGFTRKFEDFESDMGFTVKKKDQPATSSPDGLPISAEPTEVASSASSATPQPDPAGQTISQNFDPGIAKLAQLDPKLIEAIKNAGKPIDPTQNIKALAEEQGAKDFISEVQTGEKDTPSGLQTLADDPLKAISQSVAAFNQAVVSGAASIPKTVGVIAKQLDDFFGTTPTIEKDGKLQPKHTEDYATYKGGQWLEDKAREWGITATDPDMDDSFWLSAVPQGLGSVASIVLLGGPKGFGGRAVNPLAPQGISQGAAAVEGLKNLGSSLGSRASAAGSMAMAVPEFDAAKHAGKSDEEAFKVFWKNYAVGTTEVFPIENALAKINKISNGKLSEIILAGIPGGLEEGLQETVQTVLTNKIAAGSYDPKRDAFQDVLKAGGAGFFVGFILPGIGAAMQSMTPEQRDATKAEINTALKSLPNEQPVTGKQTNEQEKAQDVKSAPVEQPSGTTDDSGSKPTTIPPTTETAEPKPSATSETDSGTVQAGEETKAEKGKPIPKEPTREAVSTEQPADEFLTSEESFSDSKGKKYKILGKNTDGEMVGEDQNGVRAVSDGKTIKTQPVTVIPGKGTSVGAPEGEFLTSEESEGMASIEDDDIPTTTSNEDKPQQPGTDEKVEVVPKNQKEESVQEQKEEVPIPPSEESDDSHGKYIDDVAPRIGTEELNKNSLRKIAAQYGIDNDSQIKELTETAIVSRAREISKEDGAYEKLVDLYQKQPTMSHRTSESIAKQQYSTPVPIGYLAGKYVNADKSGVKTVEPSAGNGMLTIVADPKNVTVNEIDDFRGQNLSRQGFSKIMKQDGSKPLGMDRQFDAVITNPPFGGTDTQTIDGYNFNETAQIMAVRALETMKDDGKGAIIIGGNNEFDDKGRLIGRDRIFFNYLYNRYNVDDVIDISGDLYRKQGASFPIRLILVNGRKATPAGVAPVKEGFGQQVKSFEELKPRVEKFYSQTKLNPDENLQPTELVRGAEATADRKDSGTDEQYRPPGSSQGPVEGQISGSSKEIDRGGTETALPDRGSVGSTEPTVGGSERSGGLDPELPGVSSTDVEQGRQAGGTDSDVVGPEGTPATVRRNRLGADRKVVEGALSEQSGSVDYTPTSKGNTMGLKIPSSMSQEMYDAMSRLKEEVGDVDEYVAKKLGFKNAKALLDSKALSAEQTDGVALAIWNIENGDAVIIGDQCVAGETLVLNPTTGKRIRIDELARKQIPHDVLSLTPTGFKKAVSVMSFKKGRANLYTVRLQNGYEIIVTNQHRFLTPSGWKSICDHVCSGTLVAIDPSWDTNSLSIHESYAPLELRKPQDCLDGYFAYSYPYDEQPPLAEGIGQVLAPLQGDVLEHNHHWLRKDGYHSLQGHIHQRRSFGPLSKNNLMTKESRDRDVSEAHTSAFDEQLTQPKHQNVVKSDQLLVPYFQEVDVIHQYQHLPSFVHSLDGTQHLAFEGDDKLSQALHHNGQLFPAQLHLVDTLEQSFQNPTWSKIVSIEFARYDDFYDMHVPGPENYVAEGFVNHNTGIGKGRQAAAIIRYGIVSGRKPIFLTEKPNLFAAIYRDLKNIGYGHIKPFIVNNIGDKFNGIRDKEEEGKVMHKAFPSGHPEHKKVLQSLKIPDDAQVVMATYSQFGNPKFTEKINFLKAVAQDNIIILDESHNASGIESNTGLVFQEALPTSKGVVFLSGTYAKRPDNMPVYAMKSAMKEANMETEELVNAIVSGGTALQEIISGQLAEAGQLIRRQRSYENISVRNNVLTEKAEEHRKASDTVTDLIRDIIRFQAKYVTPHVDNMDSEAAERGEIVTKRGGTNMAGVDNAPYFSKVFNVVDQMLYSIKAKDTAEEAIRLLKAGKKPFIAIRGTLESNLSDLLESGEIKYGDTIDADFSYIVQKGLDGVLRITIKDPEGNKSYEKIDPKDLGPGGFAEYNRIKDKIKTAASGLSISPIDELVQTLQKAGYKVGEVTGRQSKLALSTGKKRVGILDRKKREPVDVAYKKYNSGEYDVLVVNSSGSTGEDAHADAKFKDKRQRVELVLQPELNINTLMQIIGRVNRTGQVIDPEYQFINSAIPAEQRLMAMTMRKLKSLDANTTSNQKQSKGVLDVPEFFNKYGDQVVIEYLQENPEVIEMIGDPLGMLRNEDLEASKPKDAALRVSGRVAILPVKEQERFYNEIIERYGKQLEYLNDAGINDLEVTSLPLRAKTMKSDVTIVGKGGKTAFGDDTSLEEVEVDVLRKPLKRSEIDEQIKELSEGDPKAFMAKLYDQIQAYSERMDTDIRAEYANDLSAAIDEVNANQKLTTEQKTEQIDAERVLSSTRLENKIKKEQQRLEYVKSLFRFFQPGRAVRVPTLLKDTKGDASTFFYSDGLFMGFDINLDKPKPFLPSNIRLRFAVNDGRVSIPIPASKIPEINYIRTAANDIASDRVKQIQQWDDLKKPKGRERRMMVTGNLLQGLAKFDGKIVKYTTDEGYINTGILLPEGFDVKKAEEAQEVSVPAVKFQKVIEKASRYSEFKTADTKVSIRSEGANRYSMRVPLSKSRGGKYYLDGDLLDLVDGNNFNSVGQEMEAKFPSERLAMVLDVLQNKFGASFVMSKPAFDKAIEAKTIEMTQRSAEMFEPIAQLSLFPFLTPSKARKTPVNKVAEDALRAEIEMKNDEAEKRYREASGPSPTSDHGKWNDIKDSFSHMITGFTSHFKHLNPRKFPREAAILRVFETVKKPTGEKAKQYLKSLVEPLTKEQYDIFTRRIVLEDLLGGIEKKLEDPDNLPFGFKSQKELEREIQKYVDLMVKEPAAQEAYDERQSYMDMLYQALVANGLLTRDEDRGTYYHRRVIEYMEEEENQRIIHGKRLSKSYKDWRRARTGTKGKDYSTNFIESEYRVVAEGLYELEKQRILNELMGPFESALKTLKRKFNRKFQERIVELETEFGKNSEEVKAYKENKRSMMKSYIDDNKPPGSTFYQPTPGNALFVRKLVSQEAMEQTIQKAGLNEDSGIGTAMQLIENIVDMADPYVLVGQRRKEYLVPQELANQLEEMGQNVAVDPNLLSEITSAWKVYVLLNPNRFVKYNINNFFGDVDGTLAADPSIFKKVPQAWRELKALKQNAQLKVTPELNEAIRHNVIDSGWELTELADINNAKWAQFFSDQIRPDLQDAYGTKLYKQSGEIIRSSPGKVWNWYWDKVKGYTRTRENVLRYAAYLRAKEKVDAGEKFYWASNPTEIDGIASPDYRAGKLAREVLGDYGNISITGQRIRRYMIPFFSWMEINMSRYYRLFKNASSPRVQARIGAVMAKRGVTAIAFRMMWAYGLMGMMTALIEAWNWFRFPEETEKMRRANARGMQLILGTTEDGKVMTLPIVGAFFDFLDFFGIPDLKDDMALIFSGEAPTKGLVGAGKTFAVAPFTKIVQSVNPFLKMGYELITGGQIYPDPTNPRPIYDYKEYFAQFLSLQDEYKAIVGTPTRAPYFFGHFRNLVVREIDPDELSYFMAKRIVETQTGRKFDFEPTAKSDALYKYGLSVRYGHTDEALKWMNEYYSLGGTPAGLNASLRGKNPVSKLSREERFDVMGLIENPSYPVTTTFGKSLTPKEIKIFRDAMNYYSKTYDPNATPRE